MKFQKPAWLDRFLTKHKKGLSILGKVLMSILLVTVVTGCMVACVLTVYVATNFKGQTNLPDVSRRISLVSACAHLLDNWQLSCTIPACHLLDRQESCSSAGNCQADEQTLITQLSRQ